MEFAGTKFWARYDSIQVTGDPFYLILGKYDLSSTAGDDLRFSSDVAFSALDKDVDTFGSGNCA